MRWKKIKLTDKDPATVEIGYQLAVSGGYVDHLVTSPEAQNPDLVISPSWKTSPISMTSPSVGSISPTTRTGTPASP
jgi:hypothetical protein